MFLDDRSHPRIINQSSGTIMNIFVGCQSGLGS